MSRTGFSHFFDLFSQRVTRATGSSTAFLLALATVILWIVTGPVFQYSDTWQLVINTGTTIVTFLMVFLIQNAQNRDAAAMQAKLDELLRAVGKARDRFIGVEHLTEREIELIRAALEREARDDSKRAKDVRGTVDRLLDRF